MSPLWEPLKAAVRAGLGAGSAPDVDPTSLVHLAREHAVLPHVCAAFPTLSERAAEVTAQNLHQAHALVRAVDALTDAGVEVMSFKGPTLALQAFGRLGARQFADVDLLVRPGRVRAAWTTLEEAGWRGDPDDRAFVRRRGALPPTLILRDGVVELELHAHPGHHLAGFVDTDDLWDRPVAVELAGGTVLAPRAQALLPVLLVHGTQHTWSRLGWVADIAGLSTRGLIDWPQLIAHTEWRGAGRMARIGLALARDWLHTDLPYEITRWIDEDPRVAPMLEELDRTPGQEPTGTRLWRFRLRSVAGLRNRARLVLDSLRGRPEQGWRRPFHLARQLVRRVR